MRNLLLWLMAIWLLLSACGQEIKPAGEDGAHITNAVASSEKDCKSDQVKETTDGLVYQYSIIEIPAKYALVIYIHNAETRQVGAAFKTKKDLERYITKHQKEYKRSIAYQRRYWSGPSMIVQHQTKPGFFLFVFQGNANMDPPQFTCKIINYSELEKAKTDAGKYSPALKQLSQGENYREYTDYGDKYGYTDPEEIQFH